MKKEILLILPIRTRRDYKKHLNVGKIKEVFPNFKENYDKTPNVKRYY